MNRLIFLWLLALLLLGQSVVAADARKVLRYPMIAAETGFDPAAVSDAYSDVICSNIFEAPLAYDPLAPSITLIPATLKSLPEVRDEGKTYILHLRPGIYFADDPAFAGKRRELTAQDYVYSWQRLVDPTTRRPWAFMLRGKVVGLDAKVEAARKAGHMDFSTPVEGLRALDRYTLQLKLLAPDYNLPYMMAHTAMAAMAREVVEKYGDDLQAHPVGTGPYRLQEWQRGHRTVLQANPGYRTERYTPPAGVAVDPRLLKEIQAHPLPAIDRIELLVIESGQSQWLAFQNGDVDMLEEMSREYVRQVVVGGQLEPKLAARGIRLYQSAMPEETFDVFNMDDPVFGGYTPERVALRRALIMSYPIGQEAVVVRNGQVIPAQGMWAPGLTGYDPQYRNRLQQYNPAEANALLDTYGYRRGPDGWRRQPNGQPLLLSYLSSTGDAQRQLNELWKKGLDAIGVRVRFESTTFPDLIKRLRGGQFQITGSAWIADYPDAENFLQLLYGPNKGEGNDSRFDLPAYNQLYREINTMPPSPLRQAKILQMQRLIAAYSPLVARVHRLETDLLHPWVLGYAPAAFPKRKPQFKYLDIDLARLAQYRARAHH